MRPVFVERLEEPLLFSHRGVVLKYGFEKDHLVIIGSVFSWNWDSGVRAAVRALRESLTRGAEESMSSLKPEEDTSISKTSDTEIVPVDAGVSYHSVDYPEERFWWNPT